MPSFTVEPVAGALGAEITGIDLGKPLSDETLAALRRAWLDHGVVFFRDQELPPAAFLAFARRFGEVIEYPFVKGLPEHPEIIPVLKQADERVNFGGIWHSDTTYLPQPPLGTLLYALETPTHGGDTLFASTSAAYDALSEGMRKLIDGLVGVNSASLKYGGGRTKMHQSIGGMKVHDTDTADGFQAEHPVARTHPETGRKALYVSRSHTIRFRGMTEDESRPLVEYLQAHQIRPEFTCRVRWAPGTLTIWDNRCTQHNAVNDYHGQRRRMRRLTFGPQTPR